MLMQVRAAQLLIIDIQEKLIAVMSEPETVRANSLKLIAAARHFQIPVTITEQYPKGIGHTDSALMAALGDAAHTFEKMAFSAAQDESVRSHINTQRQRGRDQVVLFGIEAHVCLLQTAFDLMELGYEVFCVEDAVSSRLPSSKSAALARLSKAGAEIVTTEMVLFEWLGRAGTPDFKALLPLIK